MNTTNTFGTHSLALLVLALPLCAQQQTPSGSFTSEQLEQIAAPIALYPDSLITQVLMAATYPLEVVQAYRWVDQNPGLRGEALEDALKQHNWDPSVKSLCGFPTILKQMNDNLDWTQDLGDAFLAQKTELMDTIQRLRQKALEAGTLKTTEQQRITQDKAIIIIEPANPEIIFVPVYSPVVVYGPGWYYSTWDYPWLFVAPPFGHGFVSFNVGYSWGSALWGHFDWHHRDMHVDIEHFNRFNAHTDLHPERFNLQKTPGSDVGHWQHNPEHRKGVNYRNNQIARQFSAGPGESRVTRDQARGFDRAVIPRVAQSRDLGAAQRQAPPVRQTPRERSAQSQRPAPPDRRAPRSGDLGNSAPTVPSDRASPRSFTGRPIRSFRDQGRILSGYHSPGVDRAASTRGAMSRAGGASRSSGRGRR